MGIEWFGFLFEGVRKIIFEMLPSWLSERLSYRLDLSVQLRNQLPAPPHNKLKRPIVSLFVTIRNSGTKPEYIHQCGFDGSYKGSDSSTVAEWKEPIRLQERTLVECELRVGHNHEPVIKALWVENALQKRWFLPKKQLKKLNDTLKLVWERNHKSSQKENHSERQGEANA